MKIPTTAVMDENSVSHHNGGQVGSQLGIGVNNKPNDEPTHSVQYTIPGILHFIQHEWARFEMERSQWEVDRAELEARISFLQGERKGQENLKNDLVRRIKMLEYALKQERANFHNLKYGVELQQGDIRPPSEEAQTGTTEPISEDNYGWRQGKQLIKQYLAEVGYADAVLDARSTRIHNILGLQPDPTTTDPNKKGNNSCKGPYYDDKRLSVQETAAVFANFEFLGNQEMDMDEMDDYETKQAPAANKQAEEVDHEAAEVLNELNLITETETDSGAQGDEFTSIAKFTGSGLPTSGEGEELGELAQLTVSNEPDSYNVHGQNTKEAFRKTWNVKYTLRSHFDAVRAIAFHPSEAALVTASDDHTLKLWNLQRTVPAKKSGGLDVEPLYTFRGHLAPVLSVAIEPDRGDDLYSGAADGSLRVWSMPGANADPYDAYEPRTAGPELQGHTDAVWAVAAAPGTPARLLSASADGTVRLWAPRAPRPLLTTMHAEPTDGLPAAADWAEAGSRAVVGYTSGTWVTFDIETGQSVTKGSCDSRVTAVRSHPALPLTITAHEDRHIRFWDNNGGRLAHAMVAHLDAVTGLAVDPEGLFLLSGSHDCSVRLWNLDARVCVQEITAHRKKFDESILAVAFHPSRPYNASAGADGLAKVFI